MDVVFSGLLGAIVGAALTGLFRLLIDQRLRYLRQTELVIALHAEIVASLMKVKEQNTPDETAYALIETSPFGIADETDFVFDSIKGDPALLPKDIIYPVIRYYKLAGQSNAMVRGLLEEAFRKDQSTEAKKKYVRQITELTAEQELAGYEALDALERVAQSRGETELKSKRTTANVLLPQERVVSTKPKA